MIRKAQCFAEKRFGSAVCSPRRTRSLPTDRTSGKKRSSELLMRSKESTRIVAALWKQLPDAVKRSWAPSPIDGITSYNSFLGENANRLKCGESAVLTPGTGLSFPSELSVIAESGCLMLRHMDTSGLISLFVQKTVNGFATSEIQSFLDLGGEDEISICHLEPDASYFTYCICSDPSITIAKRISKSVTFNIGVSAINKKVTHQ